MTTLLITIDRASMSLSPLVLSATLDGTTLGVDRFVPPAKQARIGYLPDEPDISESIPFTASYGSAVLSFTAFTEGLTETQMRNAIGELEAATARLRYPIAAKVGTGPTETWTGLWGSVDLVKSTGRDLVDIRRSDPVYAITVPVESPIPVSVT